MPPIFDDEEFRITFSEFSDSEIYPSPLINFWAAVGEVEIDFNRYQDLYVPALYCYVGHNLVLAAKNRLTAERGRGIPGQDTGVITSKHIEGVSKSMDVNVAATIGGGEFNLTTYGLKFLHFRKMATIGGFTTGTYRGYGIGVWH